MSGTEQKTKTRTDDEDLGKKKATPFVPTDFFVDFLGGLIPGILFSLGSLGALSLPIFRFLDSLDPDVDVTIGAFTNAALTATAGTPNAIWIAVIGASIGFCYVIGHLFYRQDPKVPNKKSFIVALNRHLFPEEDAHEGMWRILGRTIKELYVEFRALAYRDPDDRPRVGTLSAEREKEMQQELACAREDDCEFPFPFYHDYLERRGLHHLQGLVRWRGDEDDEKLRKMRSKVYINLLKIRLRHHFPGKANAIVRNEAHVRLASSVWYVSRALSKVVRAGFYLVSIAIAFDLFHYYLFFPSGRSFGGSPLVPEDLSWIVDVYQVLLAHAPALALSFLLSVLIRRSRSKIENFLHYQRLREVFFVLETAYTAFSEKPALLYRPFRDWDVVPPSPRISSPPGGTLSNSGGATDGTGRDR